jgi:hypothetical protein
LDCCCWFQIASNKKLSISVERGAKELRLWKEKLWHELWGYCPFSFILWSKTCLHSHLVIWS